MRSVVDHVLDGNITIDDHGTVQSFNPAAEKHIGYQMAEVIDGNVKILMPEPYHSEHDRYLANYLRTGQAKIIGIGREVVGQRKDGSTFPMDLAVSEFHLGQDRYFTGIVRDITERKRLEQQLQQSIDELERRVDERTRKLQEINTELEAFTYSISHDLRAPLRAIQGVAQALLEDYGTSLDPVGQDYARRLVASARRMDGLIQDLLAYSRLSRLEIQKQRISLGSVVADAVASLQEEINERQAEVTVDGSFPQVIGHRATVVQVVTNLLTNALKFVPPGQRPRVCVRAEQKDGWGRLWVEDQGIGIAPEHQQRIFNVFERLHGHEAYPGTGIGLAIVKKGMERLGGRYGLESEAGRGSRFWIDLPLVEDA
jgi:PAS domain S-box-containing protein